jgi:hypothetical protein
MAGSQLHRQPLRFAARRDLRTVPDPHLSLGPASGETLDDVSASRGGPGPRSADWGHISAWEDLLITTVEPHVFEDDRTRTLFPRMADIKGRDWNATSSRRLVVMDRHTGEILWTRDAEIGFRHNTIVTAAGLLFLIDGLSDQASEALQRRGLQPDHPTILALDAATGQTRWQSQRGRLRDLVGIQRGARRAAAGRAPRRPARSA